ncbi:MAG: N-acetylmuramoyl-L-alanine amidase-like domain-containing protein [Bacteroidota bacterium]
MATMNRRDFISRTTLSTLALSLPFAFDKSNAASILPLFEESDEEICKAKFDLSIAGNLADKPINEVIVEIGRSFIGTEYAAHSLEEEGPEHLVVNLRVLDCVSFYENSLALARCVKMKKLSFGDYKAQLQFIRYRSGIINGYPSRLHYTTDYWFDNEKKGVLRVVTAQLFGEKNLRPIQTPINFMTTHRSAYRQLANEDFFETIRKQETEIGKRKMFFLPKENIRKFADKIKTGSLIGITTNIPGLDISHTGIAVRVENGSLHLMHAPDVGYKVQITDSPLHEYLAGHSKQTGIIVAEALEPK